MDEAASGRLAIELSSSVFRTSILCVKRIANYNNYCKRFAQSAGPGLNTI